MARGNCGSCVSKWTIVVTLATVALLARQSFAQSGVDAKDTMALKGKAAPSFALSSLDGKKVELSGEKGKVVVLDFWATWCPPCRLSLPHVQKMAGDENLAKRGLKVYAVNAHEAVEKIKPFMAENKYSFAVPLDADAKTMEAYFVHGIPTTVIVGRDGTVQDVFIGYGSESAAQIDAAVEKALGKDK